MGNAVLPEVPNLELPGLFLLAPKSGNDPDARLLGSFRPYP